MSRQEIDPHILEMLTPEGFEKKFFNFCVEYDTQAEAYEATERLYERHFKNRKYTDFDSFRAAKSKRKNKKHGKNRGKKRSK